MPREKKVAIAFVHGMGMDAPNYSKPMQSHINKLLQNDGIEVVMEEIRWWHVFKDRKVEFQKRVKSHKLSQIPSALKWIMDLLKTAGINNANPLADIRNFMIDYLSDTIAYQVLLEGRDNYRGDYDDIHIRIAKSMHKLANESDKDAPLIIVAHSLGTVVASNYIYDLQQSRYETGAELPGKGFYPPLSARKPLLSDAVRECINPDSELERGETLSYFVTMGSPLAVYNMRYREPLFGLPINVPSPKLQTVHKALAEEIEEAKTKKEMAWLNYFDSDDIVAFPLAGIEDLDEYKKVVQDKEVSVGKTGKSFSIFGMDTKIYEGDTPLAHNGYWDSKEIAEEICKKIKLISQYSYR